MKKLVTLVLCLMMLLTSAAFAEGMGVQVIGGPAVETEPVSLDDFKLEVDVEIDGYGILRGTSFEFQDLLGYYKKGNELDGYNHTYYSNQEADFAILRMDITNTALRAHNFIGACEVRAVYDEVYEYAGWFYQSNYNNRNDNWSGYTCDRNNQSRRYAIHKDDVFPIDPMYQGHYIFGCTLPNAVINSKKPLKLIITIDGNEITYNIRK